MRVTLCVCVCVSMCVCVGHWMFSAFNYRLPNLTCMLLSTHIELCFFISEVVKVNFSRSLTVLRSRFRRIFLRLQSNGRKDTFEALESIVTDTVESLVCHNNDSRLLYHKMISNPTING